MFAEERRVKILNMIKNGKSVKVSELTKEFNVSESTIRRDLMELERAGKILRTHGGAIPKKINKLEATFLEKKDRYAREKEMIGKIAAMQIEDGDTVIIDSGTTTYYIAKYLEAKNITIITNSIVLAYELSSRKDVKVISSGGFIRTNTKAQIGPMAEKTIKQFRVDKAFLGANGVSINYGITTPTLDEAIVKQAMIDVASKVYFLVDESKFGQVYSSLICNLDRVDFLVTNKKRPEEEIKYYKKFGIEILTY